MSSLLDFRVAGDTEGEIRNNYQNPKSLYVKATFPQKEQVPATCRLPWHGHLWRDCPQNPSAKSEKRKKNSQTIMVLGWIKLTKQPSKPERWGRRSQSLSLNHIQKVRGGNCQSVHGKTWTVIKPAQIMNPTWPNAAPAKVTPTKGWRRGGSKKHDDKEGEAIKSKLWNYPHYSWMQWL